VVELPPDQRKRLYDRLIKITQAWALRRKFDLEGAIQLRRQAILSQHANYLESIPVYRRFAQEEGIGPLDDVEPIKRHLMFPDDLFKSYDQNWLDERNFARMNGWLSEIHSRRIEVGVEGVDSIDAWIDRLSEAGVRLVYSSGTSGNFSFVPRDTAAWDLFRTVSAGYLAPLLMYKKLGTPWQRWLTRIGCSLLSPEAFARASRRVGAADYDAVFLDFSHGHTGNQTLEQELAGLFRRHTYLYETSLSPSLLRLARRGPKTEADRSQLLALQEIVNSRKEENYARVIDSLRSSTGEGQKVFIFGTTHQYKELCEGIAASAEKVRLKKGSLVLFGGGWKSFTGERMQRDQLVAMMSEALGLPEERILEGYSMTEINAFMLRCDYGRFHIPPFIEPVLFDEELELVEGKDVRGIFGFLDPFATAYPGFLISGDEVHYVEGECPCGLVGAAVTEIGRAGYREVKGCGGIMASLAA
jgi:hypothetical protein